MNRDLGALQTIKKASLKVEDLIAEMRILILHETFAEPERVLGELQAIEKELARAQKEISVKYE